MSDGGDTAALAMLERPKLGTVGVAGVVMTGLLAALVLPGSRPGLSFFLVGVAVAVTVWAAAPQDAGRFEAAFGSLGLSLTATAIFLSAGWVIAVDLLAALALACVVATRAVSWSSVFVAPLRVLEAIPWIPFDVFAPVARLLRRRTAGEYSTAIRTTGFSLALVVVFGTLFVSADAAFAHLANQVLMPDVNLASATYRMLVFALVAVGVGALVLVRPSVAPAGAPSDRGNPWVLTSEPRQRKRAEWVVPIVTLDVLFALFVAVQMTVLFGGSHHVQVTPGLTYAEYARQGFFQLLAVAALVLLVVAVTVRVAKPKSVRDRRLARVVLGSLCALTLVVLASAWYRLGVYEDVYGLSRLRISVYAAIAWLGSIFGLVIAAGVRWNAAWLPRACIAACALGLLAFNVVNPDLLIARRNVERFEETGAIDLGYLATLSEDAIPALDDLPEQHRDCVLAHIAYGQRTQDDRGWTEFNLSRNRARQRLDELDVPASPAPYCLETASG